MVTRCELMQRTDLEPIVHQAIWEALVIGYYRSFTIGKSARGSKNRRMLYAEHVERLGVEHTQTHDLVRAERNRRVAHRDDSDDPLATRSELTPGAVESLARTLLVGLERTATAEENRLIARITKREKSKT